MKTKLLILIAGTFLSIAYLVGCGGGGNNNNSGNCPANTVWNGSSCVASVGNAAACQVFLQQGNQQQYQLCMASSGCAGQAGYAGGYQPGYQSGYYNGATAAYPQQQQCGVQGGVPGQYYNGGYYSGGYQQPMYYPPPGYYQPQGGMTYLNFNYNRGY